MPTQNGVDKSRDYCPTSCHFSGKLRLFEKRGPFARTGAPRWLQVLPAETLQNKSWIRSTVLRELLGVRLASCKQLLLGIMPNPTHLAHSLTRPCVTARSYPLPYFSVLQSNCTRTEWNCSAVLLGVMWWLGETMSWLWGNARWFKQSQQKDLVA